MVHVLRVLLHYRQGLRQAKQNDDPLITWFKYPVGQLVTHVVLLNNEKPVTHDRHCEALLHDRHGAVHDEQV